jgi:hypothetical protein
MIFCKIDNELISIIKKYAGRRGIVDVGCGDGLLGSMLEGVISIDFMPRESALIYDIIEMDAVNFPFNKPLFPVFIRPCHGHFVSRIMDEHKYNVEDFLYVSMPHNLERDVDLDVFNAEQVEDWTDEDGEKVYLLTLKEE